MRRVIECVPNFSEGRDQGVIETLRTVITTTIGAHVVDVHSDRSHHRSVFTIVGSVDAVAEATFQAVRTASTQIDLRRHHGAHPRIGAADVVPFVPLAGLTLDDCVDVAHRLGRRVGEELGIPVFLYGHGVPRALPAIRRGGLAGLAKRIEHDEAWIPDFGPRRIHPTAGGTAVGVRNILVAYNVMLDCESAEPAKQIARAIRSSDGGLPEVRALGFLVAGRGQVSMNLLDIDTTPPLAVFRAIQGHAAQLGVGIVGSEIVGLVPERALPPDAKRQLMLLHAVEPHLLESRVRRYLGDAG